MTNQTQQNRKAAQMIADRGTAASLCERLQETAARMADLLSEETALLQAGKPGDIGKLQDEKMKLAATYSRDFCILKDNAKFVGANVPNHVDRLKRTLHTLRKQSEENFSALEATRAVSQGLMSAIHDIALKHSGGPSCYTSNAAIAPAKRSGPTAIAVDRSL